MSEGVLLRPPVQNWHCPGCWITDTTRGAPNRMHRCPKAGGMVVPLLLEGTKAKIEVVEREDFIGSDQVATDENGRPVMAVVTTREDGQDCTVYAPTASGIGGA